MCCYGDLVPHSYSAGRDWAPGEGGEGLAPSCHTNIILILLPQLFPFTEEFLKVNSNFTSNSFSPRDKRKKMLLFLPNGNNCAVTGFGTAACVKMPKKRVKNNI